VKSSELRTVVSKSFPKLNKNLDQISTEVRMDLCAYMDSLAAFSFHFFLFVMTDSTLCSQEAPFPTTKNILSPSRYVWMPLLI